MKIYRLNEAIELNLLPWAFKTITRMRDRGEINLINVGHGKKNRWAISEEEIDRIINLYKRDRMNKMVDGKDIIAG